MRVIVAGGGPAGLVFAARLKRRRPGADVRLYEQNPVGATFGFGVVFSDQALDFLARDDAETHALILPHLETWNDIAVDHAGETIVVDGVGFSAIGRLDLLDLLMRRAKAAGVGLHFATPVPPDAEADLLVGADGVNSAIRGARQAGFGTSVRHFANRFAWYGTTKPFPRLTQSFRRHGDAAFNAHHYRYAPAMSTFIVETDPASWDGGGLAAMDDEARRTLCERVFADVLDGHPLIANRSTWRRFPRIANERWWHGNAVLIGDALHTAHFSIGSGTRLAVEDAIALDQALALHGDDVAAALPAFEAARRPAVERLVAAADASAAWYEGFAQAMALPPWAFAMDYVTRTGRVPDERLRRMAPRFMAAWERRLSP